ncbi:MAG: hypothetical protein KAH77_01205 [Thiomargarita sp.]|nr:hypothetical protein [Thiomargarita sp.]
MKILLLFLLLLSSPLLLAQNENREAIKLSPQIRILERTDLIPTIKVSDIQQFLNQPHLISPEEFDVISAIVANPQETLLITSGFKVYANDVYDKISSTYAIIRPGQALRNPVDGEILAYEAVYLGEAILQIPGNPATLKITKASRAIKVGDYLRLQDKKFVYQADFIRHSPENLEDAYIIAVVDEVLLISQNQIVIINKGSVDEIERGHILAVNKTKLFKNVEFDDELPKEQAGILLVFRVFDHLSYALVLSATRTINLLDEVAVP